MGKSNHQTTKPGQIIALANQKGGVGKTTLAVHLAVHLSRQGKRAILIDGDPQGNATSWVTDGDTSVSGFFDLLVVGVPIGQIIRPVSGRWNIGLLPGNGRTGEAMIILAALNKPFDTIARALRPLTDIADYILIDMPPSKSAGFHELLYACDWMIVPTQLERLALEGLILMARTCYDLTNERQHGPRLLGIVPNMVRSNCIEHKAQLDEMIELFRDTVWPVITQSIRVSEASSRGVTLFDYAPQHPVAQALALIGQRLLQNTGGIDD